MYGWMGWMERLMDGWIIHGWMDGMDGTIDRWTDGKDKGTKDKRMNRME